MIMNLAKLKQIKLNHVLWGIYLGLLLVLLPHTAWAFTRFEPKERWFIGWLAAIVFEAAIYACTIKLKKRIESTPRYSAGIVWLRKATYRYGNIYVFVLLTTGIVSGISNWAHAVEFGQSFRVFAEYSVPPYLFSITFGAILPVVSLLFAWAIADTQESEAKEDQKLVEAKKNIRELRQQLHEVEKTRTAAEERANEAEQRFAAAEDLFASLFAEVKRERILAVHQRWPALPPSSISVIAEASPSYVSEVLKGEEDETGRV